MGVDKVEGPDGIPKWMRRDQIWELEASGKWQLARITKDERGMNECGEGGQALRCMRPKAVKRREEDKSGAGGENVLLE